MEITIEKINTRNNPYQLFLDSIKDSETKRRYKNQIHTFLKLIPNQIYKESLGEIPIDNQKETLAKCFVKLAKEYPDLVTDIIATYIKEDKKRVINGELSAQTLPNHIKPIKVLLDSNRVAIHWKSLTKLLPRFVRGSNDRAYTKDEIRQMIKKSKHVTDRVIVLMYSSAGFRLEAWDFFTWQDVIFFRNEDGTFKGAALSVYRGDPEHYSTFITPEACDALDEYRELWKSEFGRYPKPDDPLLKHMSTPMIRRLNKKGVRKRMDELVKSIGLRPKLPPGEKRHEVKLDHGFRKYFNTMLRRAKVDYLDKEDMMGHKVGLESHYERYNEEDFERFPEYQKAIPFLTISKEEIQKIELEKKDKELTAERETTRQLEKTIEEKESIEQKFEEFKEKMVADYEKQLQDVFKKIKQ